MASSIESIRFLDITCQYLLMVSTMKTQGVAILVGSPVVPPYWLPYSRCHIGHIGCYILVAILAILVILVAILIVILAILVGSTC